MDLQGTVKQDMHVLVDDCDVDMNVKIEEHSIQVNPEIKQEIEPYSEVPVPGISQIIPCKSPLVSTNHYQCPHCNIKIHKQTLKKHLQMRTDEKAHRCSHCGKWFASRYHMLWHMKSHTAQSHKTYQCCYCDKSFSSDRNMAQHQRIHTDEKQHQGSQIEEKVTEKSTEKPYQCGHCDKRFPFLYHLINHQNAGKSYKCIMCGKSFICKGSFAQHQTQTSHYGKTLPKFQCTYCDRNFTNKVTMVKHQRLKHWKESSIDASIVSNVL